MKLFNENFLSIFPTHRNFDVFLPLKGWRHEDFAILGQSCAKIIT